MRISQPANCEVTTHILRRLSGQFEMSIALWHVFAITDHVEPAKDSRVLWKLAKKHASNRPLDEGFPKVKGEFLCFGMAYPPAGLKQGPFAVSVQVGQAKHELAVYGKRIFGVLGNAQEVTPPRDPIAVSPEQAFGGPDHPTNPDGVGYLAKTGEPAPSIEDPNEPLVSASAKMEPAGFWPLPMTCPQRRAHLGTFDQNWAQRDWPNFAPDTEMAFFQVAPLAQQLSGLLSGDEPVHILGMHPTNPTLQFKLPRQRARCVFRRGPATANIFEGWAHTPMQPETLFLFPNEGIAVLLHRGLIALERADALDLSEVLLQLEPASLNTPPNDIMMQLYRARWLQPTEPPSHTAGGQASIASPSKESESGADPSSLAKRITRAGTVKLWPEFEYVLSQPGITAEVAQAIRQADDPVHALATELKRQLRQGRDAFEAALRDSGMTEQAYIDTVADLPQVKQVLGKDITSLSLTLELDVMTEFIDTLVDNLRRSRPDEPVAEQVSAKGVDQTTESAPDEQTLEQIRAFMNERASQPTGFRGMNLSGLYLVGLDLAGLDFTAAICEGTQFEKCNLLGAKFNQAILTRANFAHANMGSVDLTNAVCQHATFDRASLRQADLTNADLTDTSCHGTVFDGATLKKTKLNQSDLSEADFARVQAIQTTFNESLISRVDFTGAEFDRTDFIKAQLLGSDFTGVNSNRLELSGALVKECRFTDSILSASVAMLKTRFDCCRFENSDLSASNWTTASLENTLFSACKLVKLDLSSASLKQTRFSRCQAPSLSFFSCTLENVDMVQNNFMEASFHGAGIESCSMMGNNMYGADFAECKFDKQTAFEGNVTLKTSLVWRGHPSV